MTRLTITLGTWNRKRRNAAGKLVRQKRHTIDYRCPETGGRVRRSFATRAAAEAAADAVRAQYAGGRYFNPIANPTVSDAVEHWLSIKAGQVGRNSGAFRDDLAAQRGEKPHRDAKLLKMLGDCKVSALTTAQLRQWHTLVRDEVRAYSAIEVMGMLKSSSGCRSAKCRPILRAASTSPPGASCRPRGTPWTNWNTGSGRCLRAGTVRQCCLRL